jgi:hypothetical protein
MPKRFLNVLYGGVHARIDTKDMEDLSQVQKEVKIAFEDITVGYSKIQFYNKANKQIDDLIEIPDEYYKKRKNGGLSLTIVLLPSPTILLQRESAPQGISKLTSGTAMDIDPTSQKASCVRTKSDEKFIETNDLDLHKPSGTLKYLIYRLEKMVAGKIPNPNNAELHILYLDKCLEYRLDRRTTAYNLDNIDNVKLLLAVSGAGKTRMILELLYSNFGYYFTSKSSQKDFGSRVKFTILKTPTIQSTCCTLFVLLFATTWWKKDSRSLGKFFLLNSTS